LGKAIHHLFFSSNNNSHFQLGKCCELKLKLFLLLLGVDRKEDQSDTEFFAKRLMDHKCIIQYVIDGNDASSILPITTSLFGPRPCFALSLDRCMIVLYWRCSLSDFFLSPWK
jgi:hypothetical protein